jgi:hypothetical protein
MASGNLRSYAIDPVRADWSGKADPEDGVSEILTINFDEPITASLFCGSPGAGGSYNVDIYAYPGGINALAYAHNVGGTENHQWLTCSLDVVYPDSFIKGRQVEVRWTRGGADSIMYYFQESASGPNSQSPYPYGFLKVNGQGDSAKDLAMRCYGRPIVGGQTAV